MALAVGERYPWANTVLRTTAGFERIAAGIYALPDLSTVQQVLPALAHAAARHRTTLLPHARPYLGDYASAVAARLPGTWTATIEVYAHPVWQEDLVPVLWDSGELARTVQQSRIPYAALLSNDAGTSLLLTEHPRSTRQYLLGAFASDGFDDNSDDPHAPAAVALPGDAAQAAAVVAGQFLPAYERAVHQRLLATVEKAHARLDELHAAWLAMDTSGRASDGTPAHPALLAELTHQYLAESAREFRLLRPFATQLLNRLHTAESADAVALDRLRGLLSVGPSSRSAPPRLPAASAEEEVRRWRADAPVLLRQARAATPPATPAPASVGTAVSRPALPPGPSRSR
ncbi:hypothetical protein ACFWXK_20585 [Streptomyces sp. NPDC059070]|uniref:hypothetical protein n=1 Tax=Streptomyces sp. NPDC059070 TaxID=3346713 RepID=UPI0036AB0885